MMKNGTLLKGKMGKLKGIAENPFAPEANGDDGVKAIFFFNDGLRRTYVSHYQVIYETHSQDDPTDEQKIRIKQRVAPSNRKSVASIQSIVGVTPFNEWGRRTFSILTSQERLDIVQGITEITPNYTRLQGLITSQPIHWDSRIATSSIPRDILSRILRNRPNADTADGRLEVVRLMFASERYNDAKEELEAAIREFPDDFDQVSQLVEQLRQQSATRMIDEIETRQKSGQHQRAMALLKRFPDEGIAAESRERVREMLAEYDVLNKRHAAILQLLDDLASSFTEAGVSAPVADVLAEIKRNINIHNLDRFNDFLRLLDDASSSGRQKLALAVSGWIVGEGSSINNLMVALSLVQVRDLVAEYLSTPDPGRRSEILELLQREEGGTPNYIAKIVANMKPPLHDKPMEQVLPGHFSVNTEVGMHKIPIRYEVQLPDEYNPYRRYPVIVTLHGAGREPSHQIDWWSGTYHEKLKFRTGQANRHGYIVIAPHWALPDQTEYEYSYREHLNVLASIRDAMRRFSVDTDRVFLSGLSMGGDAAWDIALSHPDMWAGLIGIVATSDHGSKSSPKYISHYNNHAQYVPQYFVVGELDGDRLKMNQRDFDYYLTRAGYDTTIVEYIGRGHEHFYDEIHYLFDWMAKHKRNAAPDSFECVSRRPFDNFFWCTEVEELPDGGMIDPIDWPKPAGTAPLAAKFEKRLNNSIYCKTSAGKLTLFLSPEWIDFDRRAKIAIGGLEQNVTLVPNNLDLLEDVRQRADRLHPFWLMMDLKTGKRR